jgi:glycosyl transferase family 17
VIFDAFMFRDEDAMLDVRLEAFHGFDVTHVLVEAPWTHRGIPKPLHFLNGLHDRGEYSAARHLAGLRTRHVIDQWEPDVHPWVNEHHQRNAAWPVIDAAADDDDWVLICDVDEIPSPELLGWLAKYPGRFGPVFSVPMRTFLFAVDWEVAVPVPPACVVAAAGWLRERAADGEYLAEVRDGRDRYEQFNRPGGWHFSWTGGPDAQRVKLDTATCHTEILTTPEAALIRSGARWATAQDGGGLPVRPVDVDKTWPAAIRERRVPADWFRPREP